MAFDIVYSVLNPIFNPFLALDPNPQNPILTIFVVATIISFITTLANKLLVDQDEMNRVQAEMKEFQSELRAAQQSGDSKKMAKMQAQQGEMMAQQSKMMQSQFKPMIVTMIPILLVFWWMQQSAISGVIVQMSPFAYYCSLVPFWHWLGNLLAFIAPIYGGTPVPGYVIGWLLWYMICTFGMSQVLRKFMGFKQGF